MPDSTILSQREIDALLGGLPHAQAAAAAAPAPTSTLQGFAKAVKHYDFRRPDKFSKEQLRTLQAVHETFARLASTTLSNQLRVNVEIKLSSLDQGLYEEYVGQLSTPTFTAVLRAEPLEGSILLEVGHDVGLVLLDRLLGGAGAPIGRSHEVTDIELQLLRGVAATVARDLGEAWQNLSGLRPVVSDLHQDPQLAQVAPPGEVVIMVFLEIALLELVAGISLCTPYSVLEPVLPRLTAQAWAGSGGRARDWQRSSEHLRQQLQRTPATLTAQLGAVAVPAAEVAALQVGDVIRLDAVATRPIPVVLGGRRKWVGRPGVVDGRVAVRLDAWDVEELLAPGTANVTAFADHTRAQPEGEDATRAA